MLIDLVIATYNRADTLKETVVNISQFLDSLNAVYIINNGSTDNTKSYLDSLVNDKIKVVHNQDNLGAAIGKNIGLKLSAADVVIVIDDDAVFTQCNPVNEVERIFSSRDLLAIIQFKIVNYQTRKILKNEFPGPDLSTKDSSFNIGYFIGAGHAIRRNVLDKVGYYPVDMGLYAHEELDLSYRVIDSGYEMSYEPSISVLHKKSPEGRLSSNRVLSNLLVNRLILNRKYLPYRYGMVNGVLWTLSVFAKSNSLRLVFDALREYLEQRVSIPRKVVSEKALKYLKRNHGRLYK